MKTIFRLFLVYCFVILAMASSFAQTQQTATILNLGANTVAVDGVSDAVWAAVEPVAIEVIFGTETPSIDVTWKMLWNAEGVYVFIEADDDVWNPYWLSGEPGWASDHVELYFDVSDPQQDGGGPANYQQMVDGNYQIAPDFLETSGELKTESNGVLSCSVFDGEGAYTKEFWVPFTAITQSGNIINPEIMDVIGFDVSIVDNDGDGRQRKVWSNDGTVTESWNNCDGVGLITFLPDDDVEKWYAVTFNVDMSGPISEGKFIEEFDELWMAGSMTGWSVPGLNPAMKLSESSTNNIYTLTLDLAPGQYAYKFFKNASWEDGEPIDQDRIVDVVGISIIDCIWGDQEPAAAFSANNTFVYVNQLIQFEDNSLGGPTNWLWDFGDGNFSNLQNPVHAYNKAGSYTVKLTVSNTMGTNSHTESNYITVEGLAPVANFTVDNTSAQVNANISFTDLSENTPTSWLWDFGDGVLTTKQNPKHSYSKVGSYTVKLTSISIYGSSTEVKQNYITVGTTGISNTEISRQVVVYPNPSKGKINLGVDKSILGNFNVQIIDATGRGVFDNQYDAKRNIEIDLSANPKGIYIMHITGSNFVKTEKLVLDSNF